MQQGFIQYKTTLILFVVLLATVIAPASAQPVNFKDLFDNTSIADIIKSSTSKTQDFINKGKAYIDSMKSPLSAQERLAIDIYTRNPSGYDLSTPGADLDLVLELNKGLYKIPPIEVAAIYSAQNIGEIIPKVGDYITANGRPWSFTEDPEAASLFLYQKMPPPEAPEPAVMYRVFSPNHAKPITSLSANPHEAESLYAVGSAFKAVKVDSYTLNSGQTFYDITLEEVTAVSFDATILYYKFTKPLSFEDLNQFPEQLRVKTYDPELTGSDGNPLLPPDEEDILVIFQKAGK